MIDDDKMWEQAVRILGIMSIISAFFVPVAGLIMGIFGFTKTKKKRLKKLNLTGIILSSLIIVLVIVSIIVLNGMSQMPIA